MDSSKIKVEHWGIRVLRMLSETLPGVGALVAYVLMVCLFVVAFWFIIQALVYALSPSWVYPIEQAAPTLHTETGIDEGDDASDGHVSKSALLTINVLHGIELLFIAPLPFLVFLSLSRYVESVVTSDAKSANESLVNCEGQLHRVKTLVVGLMTASVATDLLRRAIENVSLPAAAAESLIMLVLGSFWFVLERASTRHMAHQSGSGA
jgi:hypothetical protein